MVRTPKRPASPYALNINLFQCECPHMLQVYVIAEIFAMQTFSITIRYLFAILHSELISDNNIKPAMRINDSIVE